MVNLEFDNNEKTIGLENEVFETINAIAYKLQQLPPYKYRDVNFTPKIIVNDVHTSDTTNGHKTKMSLWLKLVNNRYRLVACYPVYDDKTDDEKETSLVISTFYWGSNEMPQKTPLRKSIPYLNYIMKHWDTIWDKMVAEINRANKEFVFDESEKSLNKYGEFRKKLFDDNASNTASETINFDVGDVSKDPLDELHKWDFN